MTITYDNGSFTYNATNLTYEGVASYTALLSFTASVSLARTSTNNWVKSFASSLTSTSSRTVTIGVIMAATTSASFSLVRQVALTRAATVTAGAADVIVTLASVLTSTVTATANMVKTHGFVRSLSAGLTAASAVVKNVGVNRTAVTVPTVTRTVQVGKSTTAQAVVLADRNGLTVNLPKTSIVNTSFERGAGTVSKTLNPTATLLFVANTLRGKTFTMLTTISNALTNTFRWTSTAGLSGTGVLADSGVKVMDATATTTGIGVLESQPSIPGAARDIARDGTHDQAVLTYDKNGNQLYLPVRPTSTL